MTLVLALLACGDPPPDVPPDMIAIPAGSFTMGRVSYANPEEGPPHEVRLSAFALDATLVTVADFRAWVEESGYRTAAEQQGYGMVSTEGMAEYEWTRTAGASFRAPFGPERAELVPPDDHPATMLAWVDADAFCRVRGKRLPTEAEWEYAMRAGAEGTRFPWGDDPFGPDGEPRLNFWQGRDHRVADVQDGYLYTSPVRAYPPNAWGVYDVAGNVWQFTADWYSPDTYTLDQAGVTDPKGPPDGWARVARGGSWWCSATACSAYGLFARGKQHPEAPYANNGFRCAADPPAR
jgi:sulfatase modifying factor 1